MRAFFKVALFAALLLALSAPAYASFAYKIAVVVDPTKVVSNATDFAVEFLGTDNTLKQAGSGGQMQNALAYDARAFSDSGCSSALDFELDSYDASAPQLIMWIRIPTLSGSVATNYWICFGDASLNSNASSTGTWNANQLARYHLNDNAGSTTVLESAINAYNGTNAVNTSTVSVVGEIAKAISYNGSTDKTSLVNSSTFNFERTDSFSIGAWIYIANTSTTYILASKLHNSDLSYTGWEVNIASGKVGVNVISVLITSAIHIDTASAVIPATTWTKLKVTYDGSSSASGTKIYVNGSLQSTTTLWDSLSSSIQSSVTTTLGDRPSTNLPLSGRLDEFGIANIAQTADLETAEYNNQSNPTAGGFYTSITYSANGGGGTGRNGLLTLGAGDH